MCTMSFGQIPSYIPTFSIFFHLLSTTYWLQLVLSFYAWVWPTLHWTIDNLNSSHTSREKWPYVSQELSASNSSKTGHGALWVLPQNMLELWLSWHVAISAVSSHAMSWRYHFIAPFSGSSVLSTSSCDIPWAFHGGWKADAPFRTEHRTKFWYKFLGAV